MTTTHLILRYVHISMGMVGLLSGATAMIVRKGSPLHRKAGTVFFASMLIMAAAGAFMAAFLNPSRGNVMGGLLTFYLVVTGWAVAWRRPRQTGGLEIGAALLGLSTASAGIFWGMQAASSPTHRLDGYPPPLYFIFGGVALMATSLDVRMIAHGGLAGAARTTRHLWRMCVAMFIATSSFFLGQAKFFPASVRASGVQLVPVLLVIAALLYWLVRVRVLPLFNKSRATRLTEEQT